MNLKPTKKDYYTLREISEAWSCEIHDILYLAEKGEIALALPKIDDGSFVYLERSDVQHLDETQLGQGYVDIVSVALRPEASRGLSSDDSDLSLEKGAFFGKRLTLNNIFLTNNERIRYEREKRIEETHFYRALPLTELTDEVWQAKILLDAWTLVEAIFLMKGYIPPIEQLTVDELMAHFPYEYYLAVNSIRIGTLCKEIKVGGEKCFIDSPQNWVNWAHNKKIEICDVVDNYFSSQTLLSTTQKNNTEIVEQDDDSFDVFRNMEALKPEDIAITFAPNNIIRITTKDSTQSDSCGAVGLVNKTRGGLTKEGCALLGLAKGRTIPDSSTNTKVVSRLRNEFFKKYLGISDPFYPKRKGVGWAPRFTVIDNRTNQGDRAKERATHVPFNENFSYSDEGDETSEWLKSNDQEFKS